MFDLNGLRLVPADHPAITTKSEVFNRDEPQCDVYELSRELVRIMRDCNGIGLSANQLGIPLRIFAMRADPNIVAVNPRIVMPGTEEQWLEEGCLTYPGLIVNVKRPKFVKVRYEQPNGEVVTQTLMGMAARVFQHEMDHLDGITMLRRTTRYWRERALKALAKRKRRGQTVTLQYHDEAVT